MGNFKNWSAPPAEKCCSAGEWAKQSAPRYIPKRIENMRHKSVHSSLLLNTPKVETTKMSISWWLHKWSMICPNKGILFSHKKIMACCYMVQHKWTSKTWHWVKEARYRSPHMVWLRFYEIPRRGKSVESESDFVTRAWRVTTNMNGVSWGRGRGQGMKTCWNLDIPMGTLHNLMNALKATASYTLMNLMVCEIHLNRIRKKRGKLISQNQGQRNPPPKKKKKKIQKEGLP